MKTKYGEVKSIYDLFEDDVETGRSGGQCGPEAVINVSAKCKLCGETIKGVSELGECMISNYGDNGHLISGAKKLHIKLHETINKLGI